MTSEDKTTETFFGHLSKADQPTNIGAKLVQRAARRIFAFADVAPGSRVLEIGPGRGDFADLCLAQQMEYHAVEPNPQLAAALRERGAVVTQERVPPLPPVDGKFDLVAMINVMEHMSSMEQALQTAGQIREVLKPGGKFLIHSPDYLSWRLHFFNCDFSHNYVTTRRRLDQLLVNAGYESTRSCYMSGPFRGFGALVLAALASHMPFGALESLCPDNRIISKLFKLQLTFSRRVIVMGCQAAGPT